MSSDEEDFQPAPKAKTPKKAAAKSVESTYQKLEQLEHILKRPDTYVGSVLRHTEVLQSFLQRQISFFFLSFFNFPIFF
jgi:DNA topoisomerase II